MIDEAAFMEDPHGAKFKDVFQNHPREALDLLQVLNAADKPLMLEMAGEFDRAAYDAVAPEVESTPSIQRLLQVTDPKPENRFRHFIGVAVKLRMRQLGWETTGRKATLQRSKHIKKAEVYRRRRSQPE